MGVNIDQAEGSTEPVTNPNSQNKAFLLQRDDRQLKSAQSISSVHKATILRHVLEATEVSRFGRIISDKDLTDAIKYLESQLSVFHNSRVRLLQLERDQTRPINYTDDGGFFVVSKMQLNQETNKGYMDFTIKQVYHQFERLPGENGSAQ